MKNHPTPLRLLLAFALLCSHALASRPALSRQAAGARAAESRLEVEGLKRPATVRRDARGIPYIEAASDEDLYFAQGYVTASDRLWQMELLRRTARGELSELFGRATLEEDKRRRTYGFAHIVERQLTQASPETRAALEAYARGVNAYISALDEKTLPIEFQALRFRPRPWSPADSAVLGKNFAEALSTTWQIDLVRAAFARLPAEKREAIFPVRSPIDVLVVGTDEAPAKREAAAAPRAEFHDESEAVVALRALSQDYETTRRSLARVGLDAEGLAASNNWVVSGRRTVTGKPLLANDPHLAPSAPSIWHMVHLSAPGVRVAGVTAPGAPGVIIGHNERIAWGLTNLGPDVQDLYAETFNAEQPRSYKTPAGWREAEVRREVIKVRKGPADPSTEDVTHEVTVTRHGPVVFERAGARYALRWTALDPTSADFDGYYQLNRARNWKEFQAAISKYRGPTQNFVYADVDGHIGYYGAGMIPVRRTGTGDTPYDGATDAGEWTGHIPFAELPHVFDPPSGLIVTANSRIVGTSYRHHLTHLWAAPTRARRILDLLNAKPKLSSDDFAAIQGDAHAISGMNFSRAVVETARRAGLDKSDAKWRETVDLFAAWDGELAPDSRAARLANEMRSLFQQKILAGAVGPELAREYRWGNTATLYDRVATEQPREWLPEGTAGYAELFDAVHREARAALARRLGEDESQWTWGREAVVRFPHPLASAPEIGKLFAVEPFPQRGGGGAFAAPNVGSGVSMRLIADASNWDATRQGIALGVSGDPRSPHWRDQLEDWRASRPRAFPFTARAVTANATSTVVLTPRAK
jgi:penicillin G amidase